MLAREALEGGEVESVLPLGGCLDRAGKRAVLVGSLSVDTKTRSRLAAR